MEDKITSKQKEATSVATTPSTQKSSINDMVSETRSMLRVAIMLLPESKSVDIMEPKLSTPELRQLGLDNLSGDMKDTRNSIEDIEANLKELKKNFDKSVLEQGTLTHNEGVRKETIARKKRIIEWDQREQKTRSLAALPLYEHTAIETTRMHEIAFEIDTLRDTIDKKLPKEEMWARREKTAEAGVSTNFRDSIIFLSARERKWVDGVRDKIETLIIEFEQIHAEENPGKPIDKLWRPM